MKEDTMAVQKRKTKTSTEVKARYNKKTYQNYNVNFRVEDDLDLIQMIENEKAAGASTTEAFRILLHKITK